MEFSKSQNIVDALKSDLKIDVNLIEEGLQTQIAIESKDLVFVCKYLNENPIFYFDFLNCISAIDNGVESGTLDLLYHLSSIPFGHSVCLKLQIDREIGTSVDTISGIWKSADWHEREIYDFFGIKFNNHPDLRRILLAADWQGFPLRKDYTEQEKYHGIKVKY